MTQLILYTQESQHFGTMPRVMDLYENETISINLEFSDLKTLGARGSFTRTFRIPATKNNNSIFGNIYDPSFVSVDFNPKRKLQAQIVVDSTPVYSGHVQFKSSFTQAGQLHEYELVFFGSVIDFFRNVGDGDFKTFIASKLEEEYQHDVTLVNVTSVNDGTIGDGFLKYSLTDRGNNWIGYATGQEGTSIYETDVNQVAKAGDLTLFVSALYIWNKIIEASEFTVNETNSSTLIDELNALWIPFTSESPLTQMTGNTETAKFQLSQGIGGLTLTNADFTTVTLADGTTVNYAPLPSMTIDSDMGSNVSGNSYTVPLSARFRIKSVLNCEIDTYLPAGTSLSLRILQYNPADSTYQLYDSPSSYFFFEALNANKTASTCASWNGAWNTDNYFLSGMVLTPILVASSSNITGYTGTITLNDSAYGVVSSFYCDLVSKPNYGNPISFKDNAPIMKLSEFMSSLMTMYNLVAYTDNLNPREISFQPLGEFINAGDFTDWTNKLVPSKDVTVTTTTDYQARKSVWTYKQSNDYLNNIFTSQGDRIYGRLELLDPENDFATDTNKLELFFGSTPCNAIVGTDIPIPKFVNEKGEYVNPTPRILYLTELTTTVNVFKDNTGTGIHPLEIPLFSHYNSLIPTIESNDLNFGQETPLQNTSAIPYKTLFNRYWLSYLTDIYSSEAKMMEAFFALTDNDIYTLKFNTKIYIKDSYWRVISVSDYVIGQRISVKVKLLKIVAPVAQCALTPSAVGVDGTVQWVDADGNPADGTQGCANVYNYYWDGTHAYAFIPDSNGGGGKPLGTTTTINQNDPSKVIQRNTNGLMVNGNGNTIGQGSIASIISALNSGIGRNNPASALFGMNNKSADNLGGGLFINGLMADAMNKGETFGGGGSYAGQWQSGRMFAFANDVTATNDTTLIPLLVNGESDIYLEDDALWFMTIRLILCETSSGIIRYNELGQFNFLLRTVAGFIYEENLTTIEESQGASYTGYVEWANVLTTNNYALNLYIKNANAYPLTNVWIGAEINYTQFKYV